MKLKLFRLWTTNVQAMSRNISVKREQSADLSACPRAIKRMKLCSVEVYPESVTTMRDSLATS